MSKWISNNSRKFPPRVGMYVLATAGLVATLTAASDAQSGFNPVIIRGTEQATAGVLRLAYLASFPDGSLESSVDHLGAGAMVPGDPLIPDANPTVSPLPGEMLLSVHRPAGLSPDLIPSESLWTTPVHFGPGSVVRLTATFRAPVGPLPGGGFAIGVNARTGARDDIAPDNERIAATVNVRPGFLVRFGVPFGSVDTARVVLPDSIKQAIFSTTDPQPFTIELIVNRVRGTGLAKLKVADQVFSVPFVLSDFLAGSGPTITAVGPGIAVNSNAPGQTASVHVREFRIYTQVGG